MGRDKMYAFIFFFPREIKVASYSEPSCEVRTLREPIDNAVTFRNYTVPTTDFSQLLCIYPR